MNSQIALLETWIEWLMLPVKDQAEDDERKDHFMHALRSIEAALGEFHPFFNLEFGTPEIIMAPYIERMVASVFYYKGYDIRAKKPNICAWLDALEKRDSYQGTKSDFATLVRDIPPEIRTSYPDAKYRFNFGETTSENVEIVDNGSHISVNPESYPEPKLAKEEAAFRVLK
jgi:glutathione S-transferase